MRLLSKADPEVAGETSSEPVQRPVAEPVGPTYPGPVPPQESRSGSSTVVSTASGGVCGRASPASHRGNVDAVGASPHEGDTDSDDSIDVLQPPGRRDQTEPTTSIWQSRIRRGANRVRELWMAFFECMTMPLWAAAASLVVACISPLQRTLAQMGSIRGALDMAGNCSIPLTLVVLGAYFHSPADRGTGSDRDARLPVCIQTRSIDSRAALGLLGVRSLRGLLVRVQEMLLGRGGGQRRPGEGVTVCIAAVSRMILAPAVLLPLFIWATKAKWQRVFEE